MNDSGVSAEKRMADIRKIERRREAFCKKTWMDIKKRGEEFQADVEKYREKLRMGRVKELSSE